MTNRVVLLLLVGFLLASCTGGTQVTSTAAAPLPSPSPTLPIIPAWTQAVPTGTATSTFTPETSATICPSDDARKMGRSLADSYPFTTPEEVMTWFCQGADFEDIMVALETEELNGTPAEDMLQMRAEGLTWDEIWQVVGFSG